MTDSPIQHVSDTAFWIAALRADEGLRPDALFHDPLAARLVEGRGREIARRMANGNMVAWAVAMRTCIIDDFVRAAIASGADTVLNLGAGLDTRPYRMDLPASLRWVEVDFPDTIAFKEERLQKETPRCALRRVKLDLSDVRARQALFEELGANSAHTWVITEGVIPYLSTQDVASLADALHQQPSFRSWVTEYHAPGFATRMRGARFRRQLANAPFKFAPVDWHAFFGEHGWKVAQMRYLGEEGAKHGRLPSLPLLWRLLLSFRSRKQREVMRRATGYAVLSAR